MVYTLGEAAKATGKSKAAISRAIKTGRISADRQNDGSFKIDPSELHRVYKPLTTEQVGKPLTINTDVPAEIRELQAKLDAATQRLSDKDDTITDLRQRLDREGEERRKLTAILTDQRERTIITPPPETPATAPAKRRWWQRGRRA